MSDPVQETVQRIRNGEAAVIPTDTVYGLAADPRNRDAVRELFRLKQRPLDKPIPLLVSDLPVLAQLCGRLPPAAEALAEAFFPGPLTFVLPLIETLPPEVSAGGGTIGVRMPDHPLCRELIRRAGGFLAVTSANLSGEPPAVSLEQLRPPLRDLHALDGGSSPGAIPSTVVDLTRDPPAVLREGAVSAEEIARTLPRKQH